MIGTALVFFMKRSGSNNMPEFRESRPSQKFTVVAGDEIPSARIAGTAMVEMPSGRLKR